MEQKIRSYVNYQFRFETNDDLEDVKEEIIANLIDRYHEQLDAGKDQEEAYIEAIKSMGDFSESPVNDIPEEYSIKPSIPDILLMSGAILSIFGLLLTLISTVVGTIVTTISILLFSGSAYYLYSYSQYLRKEKMEIEKHNLLLAKIYKYMKTSFAFWAISLSLTMSSLVMEMITVLSISSIDPTQMAFNSIGEYVWTYIILFIIWLVLFLLLFRHIYNRLMHHYYLLTGTTSLKGKIREGYEFLYGREKVNNKPLVLSNKFLPIVGSILIFVHLIVPFEITRYEEGYFTRSGGPFIAGLFKLVELNGYWITVIFPFLALITAIIMIVKSFRNTLNKKWLLPASLYVWFISTIVMYFLFNIVDDYNTIFNETAGVFALYTIIILTIILIYCKIVHKNYLKSKES